MEGPDRVRKDFNNQRMIHGVPLDSALCSLKINEQIGGTMRDGSKIVHSRAAAVY